MKRGGTNWFGGMPNYAKVAIILGLLVLLAAAGGWGGEIGFWSLVIMALIIVSTWSSGVKISWN